MFRRDHYWSPAADGETCSREVRLSFAAVKSGLVAEQAVICLKGKSAGEDSLPPAESQLHPSMRVT